MKKVKSTLVLPANLHIPVLPELRDKALAALATGKSISIDASATTRVDSAGLQLLLALQRSARLAGVTLVWSQVGDEFQQCVALLGGKGVTDTEPGPSGLVQ